MLPSRVLLGTAYYPEYLPRALAGRIDTDLDLMAAAGMTAIRVGESVWSTWEPRDGVFDLDWLRPVLDGAAERGVGVLLGTPTYAVPPWLQRAHPEIAAERRTGERVPWGVRQEVDYQQPAFLFHAERVIRRIVEHHRDHPAVIGYQVDNEPGLLLPHNESTFQAFVAGLRAEYGDVETLNEAWGLTYWSHRLSDWTELWRPDGNSTPSYDLAWRRFQASRTTDFIGWQADLVRELRRPGQFVTTCLAYGRAAVADVPLTGRLDVAAGNVYVHVQDGLDRPPGPQRFEPGWFGRSVAELYLSADRIYGSRHEPFLVTETNATSIGGSQLNHPPYDGQLRQLAWALVSRGARMIQYWHWHSIHHGAETFWGGILGHALQPGRVYREIAAIGAELEQAGAEVAELRPDVDVAVLWSTQSDWALQFQPPLAHPGGTPDPASYRSIVTAFYAGVVDAGLRPGILPAEHLGDPAALAARLPVLVAPAFYIASDDELDLLAEYARAGGHLVVGPRTGYADPEARARTEVAPARLREAAGVHYVEYENLLHPLPVQGTEVAPGAEATRWADDLFVEDAEAMAWYDHPGGGRRPIVTTKRYGSGRVTYVGTVPNPVLAASIAGFAAGSALVRWSDLPDSVTVLSAVNPVGRRLWFLHNWSGDPVDVTAPIAATDVLRKTPVAPGESIHLAARDVHVLRAEA
ncbi:beta-galactosidase [Kribbella orskensis]|uniref:beta-galactosidase n=1 Tax=Kribbella orskensis TaxID=2512216 RepID=A0ABY2BH67_9ACTN|nr:MULTISPECIES: beta-galactosidase [Kribbella]TCN38302.1 beta-galactosidase [Kribbella sp. VKM Ac-2500]TCO20168.1 beta-galactosidase [Kribbella orskensis]